MMAGEIDQRRYVIHPTRFTLWLLIISSILFFGALTSAYIVSKGIEQSKDTWLKINIPTLLWYNTVLIFISSVTLQFSLWAARKGDFKRSLTFMGSTFVLGTLFLVGQVLSWNELRLKGILFASSNAGNFLYVLTGAHGLHLIVGLIFLLVIGIRTMNGKYSVKNIRGIENCTTFWHFLGLLWIYLFIFLLINHS